MADFTKAIKYNPDYADAYNGLGIAYGKLSKFDKAIADFVRSYELGISGNSRAIAYIAYRIRNSKDPFALFGLFLFVWIAIDEIRKKLHLKPNPNDFPVVHYCSLKTLKGMTKGGRFRFYNVACMDDSKEGEAFFNMMDDKKIKDCFYGDKDVSSIPNHYIGSFVGCKHKDKNINWKSYGKDDGIDAAGCNLIFDQKQFSPDLREEFGKDFELTDSKNKRPVLFRVYYENEDKDKDIKELLDGLKANLEELGDVIKKNPKHEKELKSLACELIDSVRYLFKSNHFETEHEVRIVEYMIRQEDEIKTDVSGEVPKSYIEPYENFRFNEVTLGPKTKDADALSVCVNKKLPRVQVKKSKVPYR